MRTMLAEKFDLLIDLGIITVPGDYVHGKHLATFRKRNHKKFWHYSFDITDQNFPNPARVLKSGDQLRVRAFKQVVLGTTTSEERLAFLAIEHAVYPGAQGASLVFEQKYDQLPRGFWYISFDDMGMGRLSKAGGGGVPCVVVLAGGGFDFDLAPFGRYWDDGYAFLCFSDE